MKVKGNSENIFSTRVETVIWQTHAKKKQKGALRNKNKNLSLNARFVIKQILHAIILGLHQTKGNQTYFACKKSGIEQVKL